MLSAERVSEVFIDCHLQKGEDTTGLVKAEGIMSTAGFSPIRLNAHKAEIEAMLDELPDEFQKSLGGGASFLNACWDKHGNQWTGFHRTMEQLFQLGIAIGRVECPFGRKLWPTLPGGLPYYVIC